MSPKEPDDIVTNKCNRYEPNDPRHVWTSNKKLGNKYCLNCGVIAFPPVNPAQATEGLRYDTGKARYDLIPPDALQALAEVFTRGAEKYAPRNWEKGMAWSRCFASLMRHAWAFWKGEDFDKESGQHHMAHVMWNAMVLTSYSIRNSGTDDRFKDV